ncbi:tyrosine-type recombinase/integrase [Dactylosporangium sp. NPDC005572]|uniref:site-specific integrase n=1 Tax=Dactylosporangium sp. NPDC005572 TaxID=3156889 RepID=UPI0033A83132
MADDLETATGIGDLIAEAMHSRQRLPAADEVRRTLHLRPDQRDLTVGQWLDLWLDSRRALRPTTRRGYEDITRIHLVPHLGAGKLARLTADHITAMFDAIIARNDAIAVSRAVPRSAGGRRDLRSERPVGPAQLRRIHAVLRAALNHAVQRQLLPHNPAIGVELPSARSPRPLVWTRQRVAEWQRTGTVPSPVMVWTAEHTGRFLDHVSSDPLYVMFHLMALRGLRRGEACGLHRGDVDLDTQTLTVRHQIVLVGWQPGLSAPKTDGSEATIALDTTTAELLRQQLADQDRMQEQAGTGWIENGLLFTEPDGRAIHPDWVSRRFRTAVNEAGLPPIRLHDLRHGAATLALAAGADIKTVQAMLRHSTITLTANTYTSVLPAVAHHAAEAAAALIPRAHGGEPA